MLQHPAVDQPAGMEHHACSQYLDRFAHLRGLRQAAQLRDQS